MAVKRKISPYKYDYSVKLMNILIMLTFRIKPITNSNGIMKFLPFGLYYIFILQ
jgi:hypothetical protein